MRVLHLLGDRKLPRDPDAEGSSGIVRAVLELARAQTALGHQVTVAATGYTSWKTEWEGVHLRGMPMLAWARWSIGGKTIDFRHHLPLVWLTRRQTFDVVHGHSYGYLRFLRARARIAHFHGDPFFKGQPGESLDLKPADLATIARVTDAQITVNQCFAREIERRLNGRAHVRVVHNAVDVARFGSAENLSAARVLRQTWRAEESDVVFLFAGAIVPDKGVIFLARAFARVAAQTRSAHLVIAGASGLWGRSTDRQTPFGRYQSEIEQVLRPAIESGQVHRLGKVAFADMPAVYAAADVLILPSIVREGCPMVILEAMAAGRAVIATEVGGVPEIVDARTSILVPPGDDEQLATAMGALLGDRARLTSLGTSARQKAAALSWETAALQLDTIYQEIERRKSRPEVARSGSEQ